MTDRFLRALARTFEIHRSQLRKRTAADPEIPYIAHLLSVCGLVLQDGGTEDEAIAALLHDAPEDDPEGHGGEAVLAEIEAEFGPEVARIVEECSDTFEQQKPLWRLRKETYIAHLPETSHSALRGLVADKLDNARSIVLDYRRLGDELWERFNRESNQLWYYRALVSAYEGIDGFESPMIGELGRVVSELEELAGPEATSAAASFGASVSEAEADA